MQTSKRTRREEVFVGTLGKKEGQTEIQRKKEKDDKRENGRGRERKQQSKRASERERETERKKETKREKIRENNESDSSPVSNSFIHQKPRRRSSTATATEINCDACVCYVMNHRPPRSTSEANLYVSRIVTFLQVCTS